jgi:hypothetical protein
VRYDDRSAVRKTRGNEAEPKQDVTIKNTFHAMNAVPQTPQSFQ